MSEKQLHCYFSGSVQGVGFRYEAVRLANSFGIKGWVKNLSDGRVELTAKGKSQNVGLYLQALQKEFSASPSFQEEPPNDFTGFSIRY